MAAHDFHDNHPVVRTGRVAQAVNGFQRHTGRRIKAERVVGQAEVIVHRFGNADGFDAVLRVEFRRDPQRVLAAEGNQGVQFKLLQFARTASNCASLPFANGWCATSAGLSRPGQ